MSPSRWGTLLLMLGVVVEVTAYPHQSSSISSSSKAFVRQRRQLPESVDNNQLACLLIASEAGQDGSSCTSPAKNPSAPTQPPISDPDAVPVSSCRCVPHWQCKDEKSQATTVEGAGSTSFVLDLRSSGCPAPEEICCLEVDGTAQPPPVPPATSSLCGTKNNLGVGNTFLGFKDRQSQFGEFPWVAAVVTSRSFDPSGAPLFVGGGSLIHPQVVLTVAHKISNFTASQLKVRLGEWNLAGESEPVAHEEYQVRELLVHPGYHRQQQYNGAVLLVLDRPAQLGATVGTVCLPSPEHHYLRNECVVSGWGKLDFSSNSRYQEVMKKVSLPEVDHAQCQTALQGTRLGPQFVLHESFLCAGGEEGKDACTGDGGSPLSCPLQSDPSRYVQVGVVSWGIGCGTPGVPGVYVDVAKVRPWIDQVIGEVSGHAADTGGFDLRTGNSGK